MVAGTRKIGKSKSANIEVLELPDIKTEKNKSIDQQLADAFPAKGSLYWHRKGCLANKGKCGYWGVKKYNKGKYHAKNPYAAGLQHNGRRMHLGVYATAEEAAHAHDKAAKILYGDDAVLNFPEDK